jgi:hypothetical protein
MPHPFGLNRDDETTTQTSTAGKTEWICHLLEGTLLSAPWGRKSMLGTAGRLGSLSYAVCENPLPGFLSRRCPRYQGFVPRCRSVKD